jgi:hypothetical protein
MPRLEIGIFIVTYRRSKVLSKGTATRREKDVENELHQDAAFRTSPMADQHPEMQPVRGSFDGG